MEREQDKKNWTEYIPAYIASINIVLFVAISAYSMYWMIISSNKMWLKAVGGAIFTVNLFLFVLGLGTIILKCMKIFGIIQMNGLFKSLEIILTLLCLAFCCLDLSLSTYSKADMYYQKVIDYCKRHHNDDLVRTFLAEYSTYHSQSEYIHHMSTDAGIVIEGLFGSLVACFIIELAMKVSGVSSKDDVLIPLLSKNPETQEVNDQNQEKQVVDSQA